MLLLLALACGPHAPPVPAPAAAPIALPPPLEALVSAPSAAQVGPWRVVCADNECVPTYGGEPLGPLVWTWGGPEDVLVPLDGVVPVPGEAWLVRAYGGDGCPTTYSALCLTDSGPVRTDPFGNCEDPTALAWEDDGVVLRFAEQGEAGEVGYRAAQVVAIEPLGCGLRVDPPLQ